MRAAVDLTKLGVNGDIVIESRNIRRFAGSTKAAASLHPGDTRRDAEADDAFGELDFPARLFRRRYD